MTAKITYPKTLLVKLKSNYKLLLPLIYVFALIFGLFLYLVYKIIPAFDATFCLNLGGREVCTLAGIYIYTLASLPGYIVLGSVLKFLPFELPVALSYILLIFVNLAIYFLLGAGFQKLIKEKNDPQKLIYTLIVFIFLFLLAVYLILRTI